MTNKYEAMFIIRPDLSEEEKKALFTQISDAVTKNNGEVSEANIWTEKKKLNFPLKRYREGTYYLMGFTLASEAVSKVSHAYGLNENILRVLITRLKD
jgi:small subunit ribosomal protein S6